MPTGPAPRHPLEWPAATGAVGDVLQAMDVRLVRRRQRQRRFVSATLALLVAGYLGYFASRPSAPWPAVAENSAVVVLPERQLLPDGSVIERRGDVLMSVAFTEKRRLVVLDRGEAYFRVASEPGRPFVVVAGGVEFRAVGTAFTVALGEENVEMFVTEGRVAVEPVVREVDDAVEKPRAAVPAPPLTIAALPEILIVEAHKHVLIARTPASVLAPAVRSVSPLELNQRLAWRAPKLEFSGTPLPEVIALIDRHTDAEQRARLVLGDSSLAKVRISGILRADNLDVLLDVLEVDHGIQADRQGETEIVLRKAR